MKKRFLLALPLLAALTSCTIPVGPLSFSSGGVTIKIDGRCNLDLTTGVCTAVPVP